MQRFSHGGGRAEVGRLGHLNGDDDRSAPDYGPINSGKDKEMQTNKPRAMHVVVQEGGGTGELYAHAFTTRKDAKRFRRSCAKAAYRATAPVRVPAGTDLDALQLLLSAVGDELM